MAIITVGDATLAGGTGSAVPITCIQYYNPADGTGTIDHIGIQQNDYNAFQASSITEVSAGTWTTRNQSSSDVTLTLTPGSALQEWDAPGDFTAFAIIEGDYIASVTNSVRFGQPGALKYVNYEDRLPCSASSGWVSYGAGVGGLHGTGTTSSGLPTDKQYSRGDVAELKTTEQDESIPFTLEDYGRVSTGADLSFVSQTGSSALNYAVFNFKDSNATDENFSIRCILKTNRATTGASWYSPVYLDLYNINSSAWEPLASNASSGANAYFTINTTKSTDIANYFSTGSGNGQRWITARVYQRVV